MNKTIKNIASATILTLAIFIPNAYAVKDGQNFKDWKGKCDTVDGNKFCGVTHTVFDEDKKPVINVFIRKVEDSKDPIAFIKVPLGVNLQAGLGLAVDRDEIARIPYTLCDPAGCNAIVKLDSKMIKRMKSGKKMQIGVFLGSEQVALTASLSGISKAIKSL